MPNTTVAAVVLAAGGSTRFGRPKQLLTWEGRPLIVHAADTAWMAGLDPVVVVVGAAADHVIPLLDSRPVQIVQNYRWREGLSSSVNVGVAALPPQTKAAIFLPVDQPMITPQLLQRFVAQWKEGRAEIIVPRTEQGQRGAPVLFAEKFFAELGQLSGDVGGRALFNRHKEHIVYLPIAEAQALADVDTPEVYHQLRDATRTRDRAHDFGEIRGLICDMDGVLWRGKQALPGLPRFFKLIRELELEHVMVTNNSSHTPEEYVDKLQGMGVRTTVDHVLTSAVATARYVAELRPGAAVYAMGGAGVREALRSHGLAYRDDPDTAHVDVVVVGWDRELTWQKLATATRLILNGATFVGTNPDLTFPMESSLAPGNGAQIAALEAATGIAPTIVGKPSPPLYQQAMARMGTTPETTLVIGDRLDTDILGGVRLGMPTALVLTGISKRDEAARGPIRPSLIFEDLPALVDAWQAAGR
ncbi:MAG: HAD-IIA family hydrolase [Anaerolineae bacterium]